jgi:hypothetical protein
VHSHASVLPQLPGWQGVALDNQGLTVLRQRTKLFSSVLEDNVGQYFDFPADIRGFASANDHHAADSEVKIAPGSAATDTK